MLLSDDLIDLHETVWGAVKETRSDRETGEHCTIILSKIRRGTPQSHLNNKKVFFKGLDGAPHPHPSHNRHESSIYPIVDVK